MSCVERGDLSSIDRVYPAALTALPGRSRMQILGATVRMEVSTQKVGVRGGSLLGCRWHSPLLQGRRVGWRTVNRGADGEARKEANGAE